MTYAHRTNFELRNTSHVGKTCTNRERVQGRDWTAQLCFP